MLDRLRFWRTASTEDARQIVNSDPPDRIEIPGQADFDFARHLQFSQGLPRLDWSAVRDRIESITDANDQKSFWTRCERAWLLHLGLALGPDYRLEEDGQALLLSALKPRLVRVGLAYVNGSRKRILQLLNGMAEGSAWGRDILIVFKDHESYYRYAGFHYPKEGDFMASSGMYISDGCGHFITMETGFEYMEPVIVHELTHSLVSHLPLPLWLDEGIAVNSENRLCLGNFIDPPDETHRKLVNYWDGERIRQFWSGESFGLVDEGSKLSYDLARILVEQFARDWPSFQQFVNNADQQDAGAAAAEEFLGLDLGETVCAILEKEHTSAWSPVSISV